MKEMLINIILLIIVIYSVGFGIYMLFAMKSRNKAYEEFKKKHDNQIDRVERKILDRDLGGCMKRENLKKAIDINDEIETLERERNYMQNVFEDGINQVDFTGSAKRASLLYNELNKIGAVEDVRNMAETIIMKFSKRIEELTKEFESL